MKIPLLCSSVLLFTPALFCQTAPSIPPQTAGPTNACPIRVTQAWMDAAGATIPAAESSADGHKTWYLHINLTNRGTQAISGFVVHAELSALPNRSLAKPEAAEPVERHWKGNLAPMANLTHRWKIVAEPNTMGLERISFERIKFADGSLWTGDRSTCSFAATGHLAPAQASR